MNKNLKLLAWLSVMSFLSVALFAVKNNVNAAAAWYGYSCTNLFWYGYSCTTTNGWVGGTYSSSSVWTVNQNGQVVSINNLLNWNTGNVMTTTTTSPKGTMLVNLSNGTTTVSNNTDTATDPKFVLPNTGISN